MTRRHPSARALAVLERWVPDSEPLAGDLLEEFERRPSLVWLWWQVMAAVVSARLRRPIDIRPLRLVELQPADAIERTRKISLRAVPINLSASPVQGIGGLSLTILAWMSTSVLPGVWLVVLGSMLAGTAIGVVLFVMRGRKMPARPTRMLA